MTVHDFQKSLALSESYADAPWWEEIYRQAFPGMDSMTCVRKDGWAQRGGIDRCIHLPSGKSISIDEKVRIEDHSDILLEYWSDERRRRLGWVAKELATDYIAYAFVPSQRCYLLPFATLRRVWKVHARDWIALGEAHAEGFHECRAQNDGYVTVGVAVPIPRLLQSLTDAMIIEWGRGALHTVKA